MTEAKDVVARISEKMSQGGPASWVDVAELLDRLEATDDELARVRSSNEALGVNLTEAKAQLRSAFKERDKLRDEMESARSQGDAHWAALVEVFDELKSTHQSLRGVCLEALGVYRFWHEGKLQNEEMRALLEAAREHLEEDDLKVGGTREQD